MRSLTEKVEMKKRIRRSRNNSGAKIWNIVYLLIVFYVIVLNYEYEIELIFVILFELLWKKI